MSSDNTAAPGHEIAASLLAELEQELGTTRTFLERVPAERLTRRPHEKSMSFGELALHIAQTPAGVLQLSDEAGLPISAQDGRNQPRLERFSMRSTAQPPMYGENCPRSMTDVCARHFG